MLGPAKVHRGYCGLIETLPMTRILHLARSRETYEEPVVYMGFMTGFLISGVIINFSTLFIISIASPPQMKKYKWILFTFQVCSISFELYIHAVVPELFLPAMAFRFHGRLFRLVDPRVVWICGSFFLMAMVAATLACIIYRHQSLLHFNHPIKAVEWHNYHPDAILLRRDSKGLRIPTRVMVCVFSPALSWVAFFIVVREAQVSLVDGDSLIFARLMEEFPNYGFLRTVPDLWALDGSNTVPSWPANVQTMVCLTMAYIGTYTFVTGTTFVVHCYYLLAGTYVSERTRRMQRQMINALTWQILIPAVTVAIPWLYTAAITLGKVEKDPSVLNSFYLFDGGHALLTSIEIVLLSRPYREFIVALFVGKKAWVFMSFQEVRGRLKRPAERCRQ